MIIFGYIVLLIQFILVISILIHLIKDHPGLTTYPFGKDPYKRIKIKDLLKFKSNQ